MYTYTYNVYMLVSKVFTEYHASKFRYSYENDTLNSYVDRDWKSHDFSEIL